MKKLFILGLITILSPLCLKSQSDNSTIKTTSKIVEVTVFQRGAQIKRKGLVKLKAGRNKVVFENLSSSIIPNTVQVKSNLNLTLISVNERSNYLNTVEKNPKLRELTGQLEDLNFKLQLRQSSKRVYQEEKKLILNNKNIKGNDEAIDVEDLAEVSTFIRKRIQEIQLKLMEVNMNIEDLSKEIANVQKQINEITRGQQSKTSEVEIVLDCDKNIPANIYLEYLVSSAGWYASYDIRAEEINKPIELSYKANVRQNTGYDWKQVKVTLSTGDPTLGADIPELTPFYVNKAYSGASGVSSFKYSSGSADNKKRLSKLSVTSKSSKQLTTEFYIKVPYDIPSAKKPSVVEIDKFQLKGDYSYYAAPKYDKDAFLLAKITGWQQYDLLQGKSSIFYKGTFVGSSYINPNTVNDTLDISLGREQGITVKRKEDREYGKEDAKTKKVTVNVAYEIKNKKGVPIKLTLEDQIPVSKNKEISVDNQELSDGKLNTETGIITWEFVIPSSGQKESKLIYLVKYPKDFYLFNF